MEEMKQDTGLPHWVTIEDIDAAIRAFSHYDAKKLSLHNWRTMLVSMKAYRETLITHAIKGQSK